MMRISVSVIRPLVDVLPAHDPETIPAQYRQPDARRGIYPERTALVGESGCSSEPCIALTAGEVRNGVLTAIEDYVALSALRYEPISLPIYYGLTVRESRRLDAFSHRASLYRCATASR